MNFAQIEPLDVTIAEAAALLGCRERLVYRLIKSGELESWKVGKTRRITLESIRDLRARKLEAEQQ
jgi:excisionase family DNA binding protein